MSSLQEEIDSLSPDLFDFPVTIQILNSSQYAIAVIINKSTFKDYPIEIKTNISFLLLIKNNHPFNAPSLFCLTRFSSPEISDGRDLLKEIVDKNWYQEPIPIKEIISKLPLFVRKIAEKCSKNEDFYSIGNYYLDTYYENEILELIPFAYFNDVIEIQGDEKKIRAVEDLLKKRKLLITEQFFLLFYETSFFDTQKMKLVFWAGIRALDNIRQVGKYIELTWLIKGKRKRIMKLKTADATNIVDLLIDSLNRRKIHFKETLKTLGPKAGKLPEVEIELVDEEIRKLELSLKVKENVRKENLDFLMNLYEKAVQYYSAVNDKRYEEYTNKIKNLFNNEEYRKIMNVKEERGENGGGVFGKEGKDEGSEDNKIGSVESCVDKKEGEGDNDLENKSEKDDKNTEEHNDINNNIENDDNINNTVDTVANNNNIDIIDNINDNNNNDIKDNNNSDNNNNTSK